MTYVIQDDGCDIFWAFRARKVIRVSFIMFMPIEINIGHRGEGCSHSDSVWGLQWVASPAGRQQRLRVRYASSLLITTLLHYFWGAADQ